MIVFCIFASLVFLSSISLLLVQPVFSVRTQVPDEIIEIVTSKAYNRHHLPSQSKMAGMADLMYTRKIGGEKWSIVLDFHPSKPQWSVHVVQKEKGKRHGRIVFGTKAAHAFTEKLDIAKDAWRKTGYKDSFVSKDDKILHKFNVSIDQMQRFGGQIIAGPTGTYFQITHRKGPQRKIIRLAIRHLNELIDAMKDITTRITAENKQGGMNVTIGIYIEGLSSFKAQSMDFHIDIYFSEIWFDHRLAHNSRDPVLIKDWDIYNKLWHPDIYFANAKEARYHTVTTQNFMVWVYKDGTVNFDTSQSGNPGRFLGCFVDAYDIENLNILWKKKDNITKNEGIKLPDMQLRHYYAEYCEPIVYATGKWACVQAVFKMDRQVMHHILQSYIPSALIVIISWFSLLVEVGPLLFPRGLVGLGRLDPNAVLIEQKRTIHFWGWLDVDAVPGRVSLCITTLLTLATQSSAARMALPQVSYAKAIDVWMGVSMAFVFGVMIEFTCVNYLSRRSLPSHMQKDEGDEDMTIPSTPTPRVRPRPVLKPANIQFHQLLFNPNECQCTQRIKSDDSFMREPTVIETAPSTVKPPRSPQNQRIYNRKVAGRVDKVCRVMFPLAFFIFNIVYWPYYIQASRNSIDD